MKNRVLRRLAFAAACALGTAWLAAPSVSGATVSRPIQNSAARDITAIKTGLNTIAKLERDGVKSILAANATTQRILQRAKTNGLSDSAIIALGDQIKRTISGKRLTAQTKLNAFVNALIPRIDRVERNAALVTSGYVAYIRQQFGTSDTLVGLLNTRFSQAVTALLLAETQALADVDAALDLVLP